MLWWRHVCAGAVKFPKSWLWTLPLRQKIHHFFFPHTWDARFKYLPEGCPYMLMYSALHIMQWFSHILEVFTPKIRQKFFDFNTFMIKTNVAYTRLEVIAKQHSALQVESITCVKLICYFVLYYCFLHWVHLPNMAVGDLAFYYTLYLWDLLNTFSRWSISVKWNSPLDITTWNLYTLYGRLNHSVAQKYLKHGCSIY